jgi:L-threonylcarbamoyladenylate synthase
VRPAAGSLPRSLRGVAATYDCSDPDARAAGLAAAARAARGGRLVVLPTDTVYGLGCDAFNADAVRGLLAAKRRGPDMPVPVLVGSWSTIDGLVLGVPRAARDLIEAFWPGGLSLVLPHAPSLAWDLGQTKGTVMLRMPLHPVALELLRDVGPMAVSSANVSGSPPASDANMALEQLGDTVDVYLDGGPSGDPVASTIVDLTADTPRILREGAVTANQVSEVLGQAVQPAQ